MNRGVLGPIQPVGWLFLVATGADTYSVFETPDSSSKRDDTSSSSVEPIDVEPKTEY